MNLTALQLKDYKNLDLKINLQCGLNLIIASNGKGKTNFLEAIAYLSSGKSFRGLSDESNFPLGQQKQQVFIKANTVESITSKENVEIALVWEKYREEKIQKKYFLQQKPTSIAKLKKTFQTVTYSPESLDLVLGSGSTRRLFLDTFSAILFPEAKEAQTQYVRVLAQKNRLLKNYQAYTYAVNSLDKLTQLKFWNEKLIHYGSIITWKRLELLKLLRPKLEELVIKMQIMIDHELSFSIVSRYLDTLVDIDLVQIKQNLTQKINSNQEKELMVQYCLYGPHRDDYLFFLNEKNIRENASRGQQRLFSFIMFATAAELVEEKAQNTPILLLDDILSELDDSHRNQILVYLLDICKHNSKKQIFLTAPTIELLPKKFRKNNKDIHSIEIGL